MALRCARSSARPSRLEERAMISTDALSRRAFLTSTGALVVTLAAPSQWASAAGIGAPARPPVTGDQLDSYITIDADGTVVAYYGKIDGGQGLSTSIAQMVAEEMDVAFEQVRVVMGDNGLTLDMGGASAAIGVSHGGMMLRRMAAETRRLLIESASQKLGIPFAQLTVTNGTVHAVTDSNKRVTYAELIGGRYFDDKVKWNGRLSNGLVVEETTPIKTPSDFKIIGQSLRRKDLPGKVFGTLEMVNDVRLPGMLHARMIRPTVAGAVPVKVDETSIKNIPGAKMVWIKDLLAVVAEKEWNAVKAARALKVTWSQSNPNFPGHEALHAHIRKAPIVKTGVQRENGKVEEGFKQAARIVEGEYEFPTQSHASMGPACAVADVSNGQATLYTSTQKPYDSATCVAELLELPRDKVRAIWMFGTGSYGRNDQGDATADAAVLSKHLGRPIRVQYMRHEGTGWDPKGTAAVNRGRVGIDANGKVIAYEYISKAFSRMDSNTRESRAADVLAGHLLGLPLKRDYIFEIPVASYTFDHGRLGWEIIPPLMDRASPLRTTHLRDPYGPPILFGSESFMDEVAAATATDPVAFRLAYLSHPRDQDAVRIAAEKYGWETRPSPRRDRQDPKVAIGRGIAMRRHFTTFIA